MARGPKQLFYRVRRKLYDWSTHLGYRYNLEIYNRAFFEGNQQEGVRMAPWFVPLLQNVFDFHSLIDVGCGTGHYLQYCLNCGIGDVLGLEGSPAAFADLLVDKRYVVMHDLRLPYTVGRRFDLAISVEVAEHIDKLYASNFIKILCDASDTVALTAAKPGQGGTAHVNEQGEEWWVEKFRRFDYGFDSTTTQMLRRGIRQAREAGNFVTRWFESNIMVFRRRGSELFPSGGRGDTRA